MKDERPDLLYVLSHGFAGRMVMHSELIDELRARGLRVAVMSPSAEAPHFRALAERRGVMPILAPEVGGKLLGNYAIARRYLFEDYERNASLRSKHEWELHHLDGNPLRLARPVLGKLVNMAALRAPSLRASLLRLEQRALRSTALARMLAALRPKVVVATYPVAWVEALAVSEAQRLGIRTVGHLLSWDNITCKGRFAAVPDKFVSWGPIMTEELASFYGARGADVVEAGVAHFDKHTRPIDRAALASDLAALGLDPAKPYVFVGMSASFFAPKEAEIVAWLARKVRAGAFGPAMQLLVRPHPQNMRGPMADPAIIARLKECAGPRVVVDLPDVLSDRLDMGDRDMERLAALLHGAAVTLNSGSTLTIDALFHDRPTILTSFDADADLAWHDSARRLPEFPHLAKLLSYGGVRVARSFAELEASIAAYVADPALDRAARRRALEAECGPPDGRACQRVADGLLGFVTDKTYHRKGDPRGVLTA